MFSSRIQKGVHLLKVCLHIVVEVCNLGGETPFSSFRHRKRFQDPTRQCPTAPEPPLAFERPPAAPAPSPPPPSPPMSPTARSFSAVLSLVPPANWTKCWPSPNGSACEDKREIHTYIWRGLQRWPTQTGRVGRSRLDRSSQRSKRKVRGRRRRRGLSPEVRGGGVKIRQRGGSKENKNRLRELARAPGGGPLSSEMCLGGNQDIEEEERKGKGHSSQSGRGKAQKGGGLKMSCQTLKQNSSNKYPQKQHNRHHPFYTATSFRIQAPPSLTEVVRPPPPSARRTTHDTPPLPSHLGCREPSLPGGCKPPWPLSRCPRSWADHRS